MFPFGSVISHIPLIILASVYLVYMGAAAVTRIRPAAESGHTAGIINDSAAESGTAGSNFYYFQQERKAGAEKQAEADPLNFIRNFNNSFIILPLHIPEKQLQFNYYGNGIYSRPPPLNS